MDAKLFHVFAKGLLAAASLSLCCNSPAIADDPFSSADPFAANDDPFGGTQEEADPFGPVDAANLLGKVDVEPSQSPEFTAADHQRATELGRKAHQQLSAIDAMNRFYLKAHIRSGEVHGMRLVNARSIPLLKHGLKLPINSKKNSFSYWTVLAWDEDEFWSHERHRFDNAQVQTRDLIWSDDKGFTREQTGALAARFFVKDSREILLRRLDLEWLPFLCFGTHDYNWVDGVVNLRVVHSDIDPSICQYRMLASERFAGETCDVVQSNGRLERFWISQASGKLRGALLFTMEIVEGSTMVDIYDTKTAKQLLPKKIQDRSEKHYWYRGLSWTERSRFIAARNEANFAKHAFPALLVRFSDYRQVAPGVDIPFYQESIDCQKAKNGFEFHRKETRVAVAKTDTDLTASIANLMPAESEPVTEQAKYVPIDHLFDALKKLGPVDHRSNAQTIAVLKEQAVGSHAPDFEKDAWAWHEAPELKRKPYLLYFFDFMSAACRQQAYSINQAITQNGATTQVVGVHVGFVPKERVGQIAQEMGIRFPIVHAPSGNRDTAPDSMPHGMLVDKQGVIREHVPVGRILDHFGKAR